MNGDFPCESRLYSYCLGRLSVVTGLALVGQHSLEVVWRKSKSIHPCNLSDSRFSDQRRGSGARVYGGCTLFFDTVDQMSRVVSNRGITSAMLVGSIQS